ncbi:hypothetical protein DM02DRAFT_700264 [Periconia macrospinosa]|uniref:Uncharacterized protein n=1 Tax=Periconia macrospinosa TaxID=97972 RepID=A0A2V1D2T1_9PLEO|nr:hypothetical protein DM02DRAFT_700264 [Periconia macrospinosa]
MSSEDMSDLQAASPEDTNRYTGYDEISMFELENISSGISLTRIVNPISRCSENLAVTASEMKYEVPANKKQKSFSTHDTRRRAILKACRSWKWELLACCVSIITFVFTIVFLRSFDGKPQPEWPYGITLNSAMSLFSIVIKSLILVPVVECISQLMWISYSLHAQSLEKFTKYDAASRGPWGSFKFLWSTKARELACLGALLTILTAAIDPTIQQMLVIRTRSTNQGNTAFIPRAQSFLKSGPDDGSLEFAMKDMGLMGSVYAALYAVQTGSSSIFEVLPTCPTGSCTFPAFVSLAVCTRCKDLTEAVETTCSRNHDITHPAFNNSKTCQYNVSDHSEKDNYSVAIKQTFFSLSAGFETTSEYTTASDLMKTFSPPSIGCSSRRRQVPLAGEFLHVTTIKGETKPNQTTSIEATACTMSLCSNHYEASVVDGKLLETITESEKLVLDPTLVPSPGWLNTRDPYFIFHDSQGLNYTVPRTVYGNLSLWLRGKFDFNNVQPFEVKEDPLNENYTKASISGYMNLESYGKEDIINLFLANDTKSHLTRLSKAITTYIRSQSKEDQMYPSIYEKPTNISIEASFAGPVEGFTQTIEVYVAVRWAWLSFSGVLLVVTWAFFILVMISSAKKSVVVWKTSPLALLYHGLHADSVRELRGDVEEKTMNLTAKQIKVQLRDSGSGLMLEKSD